MQAQVFNRFASKQITIRTLCTLAALFLALRSDRTRAQLRPLCCRLAPIATATNWLLITHRTVPHHFSSHRHRFTEKMSSETRLFWPLLLKRYTSRVFSIDQSGFRVIHLLQTSPKKYYKTVATKRGTTADRYAKCTTASVDHCPSTDPYTGGRDFVSAYSEAELLFVVLEQHKHNNRGGTVRVNGRELAVRQPLSFLYCRQQLFDLL